MLHTCHVMACSSARLLVNQCSVAADMFLYSVAGWGCSKLCCKPELFSIPCRVKYAVWLCGTSDVMCLNSLGLTGFWPPQCAVQCLCQS